MFKKLTALIIVLTFSASVTTIAEESEMKANIIAAAIGDAVRDVNRMSRAVVGYFLNRISDDSRGARTAPIPTGRFLGKPPAYVTAYTVNYRAQPQQTGTQATVGQVVGGLILIGAGVFCLWQINNEVDEAFDSCLDFGDCCALPEPGGLYY